MCIRDRLSRFRVEDLRAAVGAEVEEVLLLVRLVGRARVVAEATDDVHLIRRECRLHPEGTSGATLAGEAVTDGDHGRIAPHFQTELSAVTGGLARSHRRENLTERLSGAHKGSRSGLESKPTSAGQRMSTVQ